MYCALGEGNGNPLQYSRLENPMDGGAWRLQSMGSLRVRHDWATSLSLFTFLHWRRKWQPTPVLLPGKSHGWRSLEAAVHWVAEGQTRLSDFPFTFHFHVLEKEMATYSSVLAWRIPGTAEPGGRPSMGLHRVGHNWSDLAAPAAAGRPGVLQFMGSWIVGHDWATELDWTELNWGGKTPHALWPKNQNITQKQYL